MLFMYHTECNYGKGRWVADSQRPLYSGLGCKQWLSEMWACRLTQREDFSYEGYHWQPNDCEMPEFTGAEFLRRYASSRAITGFYFLARLVMSYTIDRVKMIEEYQNLIAEIVRKEEKLISRAPYS